MAFSYLMLEELERRLMDPQETFGLEDLSLEQTKQTRKYAKRRANRAKGRRADQAITRQDLRDEVPRLDGCLQGSWCPSAAPVHRPLSIPPLERSANVSYHQDSISPQGVSNSSQYFAGQDFLTPQDSLRASRHLSKSGVSSIHRPGESQTAQPAVPSPRPLPPTYTILTQRSVTQKKLLRSAPTPNPGPPSVQRGRWNSSPPPTFGYNTKRSQPRQTPQLKNAKNQTILDSTLRNPETLNRSFTRDPLISLPAPEPTPDYVTLAHTCPVRVPSPQRLLLVLDLNGTLLYRPKASTKYTPRPSLQKFLEYCLTYHTVLIWSSATPHNVTGICARLFTPAQRQLLLGEWGRDTLDLTSQQYTQRVQVFKRLSRIWDNPALQLTHPDFADGARWGQHNTVLIDDNARKAAAQPHNHVEVPEFVKVGEKEGDGKEVLAQVAGWLEEARQWNDVSAFVGSRGKKFGIGKGWKWDWERGERSVKAGPVDEGAEHGGGVPL